MAQVTTTKKFHTKHLFSILGGDEADLSTNGLALDADGEKVLTVSLKGDGVTPITQAELEGIVDAYTYDPKWEPVGPERDWRTKLEGELAWLRNEVATAPAAGTTTTNNVVARVDAVIQHLKRLDRDLIRVFENILNNVKDSTE